MQQKTKQHQRRMKCLKEEVLMRTCMHRHVPETLQDLMGIVRPYCLISAFYWLDWDRKSKLDISIDINQSKAIRHRLFESSTGKDFSICSQTQQHNKSESSGSPSPARSLFLLWKLQQKSQIFAIKSRIPFLSFLFPQ